MWVLALLVTGVYGATGGELGAFFGLVGCLLAVMGFVLFKILRTKYRTPKHSNLLESQEQDLS